RTVGPFCRSRTRSAASTASGSVVRGFCTEVTLSPTACNRGITSDQLDPSAKRPCTSTRFLPWTWSARKRYVTEASLPPSPPSNPQKYAYPCRGLLGGCLPRVSASLVHDRAPRPMKFHHHSGSLFSPLREGRPVPMHLECGVVSVHFVRENFRIVVLGQQDFELQRARFIFQAACLVRR